MSNNALNLFKKTFFLVLLFLFVLEESYAIPTFIDKAVKEKMEVGQTKNFCPTSLVGIDNYHPSSLNFVVQTETGLQNPGITDNIVKVTKGHENGFLNRDYIKIQAVGVGKCRVVCSCSFTIPLQQTKGIANVCYNIEVTEAIVKVTSVSLNKSELLLHKGENEVLSASISPANATSKLLEWGTSNDKIATVDSRGMVTAIADGSAIITATTLDGSNISSACQLRVITPVTSIILSKSSVMLKVDQECKLDAIILPTNATIKKLQWISSNPNIATVDNEGNVKGLNIGSCVVVAASSDGTNVHETCYVTVQKKEFVSQIVLDNDEVALLEGEEKRLSAVVLPSTADNKSLVWRSDNEKVATVGEDGLVHALSKGIAIISASSLDGSGVTSSCRVSVLRPVSEILLDRDSVVLSEGDTVRISAVVFPSTADNKSLVWRSDNEEVVTVDDDGLVHALSKGIAIISASSLDGFGVTSSCRVSVLRPVSEILLDRDSVVLSEGDTVRISAVVLPSTADNKFLEWRSDNENVATVDEDGLVHAMYEGNTTIFVIAMDGSEVMSKCEIGVLPVSSVKRIAKDRVRVYVANRKVHLENIPSGVLVRIIRPNGSEVFRMRSKMSCLSYQPHTNGLYFVMIDSLLYKVLVP